MTVVALAAAALLFAVATAAVAGVPRISLRLEERALVAIAATAVLSSLSTYLLALLAGLGTPTVLGGIAVVAAAAALGWLPRPGEVTERWHREWRALVHPRSRRRLIALAAITSCAVAFFAALFAHSLQLDGAGNLVAGFPTVWADWSQHLTTASSFAVGQNLPPHNPLFSGETLRYPFLPDFQSATLLTLGASLPVALALPGAALAVVVALLVVVLAVRLGATLGVGSLAAAICIAGGGLGFVGVFSDACTQNGFAASSCGTAALLTHPGTLVAGLSRLPAVVAAQPRAYDGLMTPPDQQALGNQQWYTPLFDWWLPQRTILYGFAGGLSVLLLALAAARSPGPEWRTWGLAGIVLGLMPLIHIHTLLAVGLALVVLALRDRRAGWLVLFGVAAALAAPRLVELAAGPHGTAAAGNVFPTVEPGWMYLGGGGSRPPLGAGSLLLGTLGFLRALISPQYWGFWIANTGIAVVLCAVVAVAALLRLRGGRLAQLGHRLDAPFPPDLRRLALALTAVFGLANIVVLQSWDWDNTKLFAWWYIGAALLIASLVAHWWRRWWRGVAATAIATSVLLTGILGLLRLLPWTPAAVAVGGPYVVASADEIRMAHQVAARTSTGAVFVTEGIPNDPLLTVAGRTAVEGYVGWLWSYGTDLDSRAADIRTIYAGCAPSAASACAVFPLLHRYGAAYVELDSRAGLPGMTQPEPNVGWWSSQGFPVVARSGSITVYDVRGR